MVREPINKTGIVNTASIDFLPTFLCITQNLLTSPICFLRSRKSYGYTQTDFLLTCLVIFRLIICEGKRSDMYYSSNYDK